VEVHFGPLPSPLRLHALSPPPWAECSRPHAGAPPPPRLRVPLAPPPPQGPVIAADPRATRHPWVAAPVASGCPPVRLARVRPPTFPRTARSHRLAASSCARPRLAAGPFHALLDLRHTILRPQVNALSLERNIEPYHAVQFEGNY
jgi:hypothetical protein